ncbi:MAG: PspC domain-containing protein [Candidatus Methylomirabilales bacterium]
MKKLYRSNKDKNIAGICGGLGQMFSIDSTLIRLAVVFITVTLVLINGAPGILLIIIAYIVAWIIVPVVPAEDDKVHEIGMKKITRSRKDKMLAGICGGFSEIFAMDSTLIRLAVVFIGLVTGIVPMIVAYALGWMIVPLAPPEEEEKNQKSFPTA